MQSLLQARPVYLMLPTDLVGAEVPKERLRVPLSRELPPNDPKVEDSVLGLICDKIKEAKWDVVVLVDACAIRHHVRDELRMFLETTGFPVYAAPMGKTLVDENYERYGGASYRDLASNATHHVAYRFMWVQSQNQPSSPKWNQRTLSCLLGLSKVISTRGTSPTTSQQFVLLR